MLKMKRKFKLKMIEQAKAAIESEKKCSYGRIETSSFNFIIEHCRKKY
jgi:hypothetical protein